MSTLNNISVFGSSGFIGNRFCTMYPDDTIRIPRNDYKPQSGEVVYFISTLDNYNVLTKPTLDVETNLIVLLKVLESFKDRLEDSCFNFISSWGVYGQETPLPFTETSQCNPTGFYSITKRCAEQLIISYCKTFGLNYRILRLGNVVGENDKGASSKKNAIQMLIQKVIQNQDVPLYDGGDCLRDYIYVGDVCRAIKLCMEKAPHNEIINVASGIPLKILDIINLAKKESGSTSKILDVEIPVFHKLVQVKDSYLDTSKLKSYGFQVEYDLEQMVKVLVAHYKENNGQ